MEYRTGTTTLTSDDTIRYFIEPTNSAARPRMRAFREEAQRDAALRQYSNGAEWSEWAEGQSGEYWDIYTGPVYDDEQSTERYQLFEGTFVRFGGTRRSFFITDTAHPGQGWGTGVFRPEERAAALDHSRRQLARFRNGERDNETWTGTFEIATTYTDIIEIPEEENMSEAQAPSAGTEAPTEQFRLFHNTQYRNGFIIANSEEPDRHWQGTFGDIARRGVGMLNSFRRGESEWETGYYANLSAFVGEEYHVPSENPVWAEPTAEQRLENLWNALLQEAKDRGWCEEFETFAAANGAPERLFNQKVMVTVEVTVPARKVDRYELANALNIDHAAVKSWDVV